MAKESTTATVEQEPASVPQTPEQIAATEKALGLESAPAANQNKSQQLAQRAPVRMGVAPQTVEEGWRLSQFIAQSELVPKGYRNRPADVLVAIQYGMEVGLPPLAALHSVYVTNGRPQLYGDGFLAVIMASPKYKDHDEYYIVDGERREFLVAADMAKDDTMAVTSFWRTDSMSQRPRTATFSIAKAKKAGLWTKSGPWTDYPDRMLKMRARSFAGHDGFPDVLRGMKATEEVADFAALNDEPDLIVTVPNVRRISETVATPAVEPIKVPAPTVDTLDAVTVKDVEQFLGGYTVTLGNGLKVDLTEEADAVELEKFVGTSNKVRMTVERVGDKTLYLKSFAISD